MKNIPDYKTWEWYKKTSPAKIESYTYKGLEANFYKKEYKGETWSCGVFSYKADEPLLIAWGIKSDTHCGFHAVSNGRGWAEAIEGCPLPGKSSKGNLMVDGVELK